MGTQSEENLIVYASNNSKPSSLCANIKTFQNSLIQNLYVSFFKFK